MADAIAQMRPGGDVEFTLTWASGATAAKTVDIQPAFNEGQRFPYIYRGFFVASNSTNAITFALVFSQSILSTAPATVTLDNQYSTVPENATTELPNLAVENSRLTTLTITPSGDPGASGSTIKCVLYSKLVGGAPNASDGVVDTDVNVAEFGGVAVQLDDTDKPAVSMYGANAAGGDTAIGVTTGERVKTDRIPIGTNQVTADLVANSSAPTEIDCSAATVYKVHVYTKKEWRFCLAADQTAADIAIASDASSAVLPSGYWQFSVSESTLKFYARSNDASLLSAGLVHWFGEV